MNVSNFLASALLNQVFRNTAYTRPATVYLTLYTSNPTGADTGVEVTGGAYARQAVTFGAPSLVGGIETIAPIADISFPVATADWGVITHAGIRDALTGGNLLYYGPLDAARTILTSDRLVVQQSSCTLTLN
jgi:hypothetical protein